MAQTKVTNDAEAIEALEAAVAYLRKREHAESGRPPLDFSHLYGEHGGKVVDGKIVRPTPAAEE